MRISSFTLSAVSLLLALVFGAAQSDGLAKPVERPNIVLIMCDDMGWSDIGCYGGEVSTPSLDRLAAEGMRFTQFYNNAKCTTTRASILTGLYPRRGKGGLLRQNMVTLGEAMKLAGYRTALSGKWHLGSGETTHPYRRGFDESSASKNSRKKISRFFCTSVTPRRITRCTRSRKTSKSTPANSGWAGTRCGGSDMSAWSRWG